MVALRQPDKARMCNPSACHVRWRRLVRNDPANIIPSEYNLEQMPNHERDASPNSVTEWVMSLFDALHDLQVLEVVIKPGLDDAIVEYQSAAGTLCQRRLPSLLVAGVLAKMKKLARLDVAERSHVQCGRVRLLDFHGSPAGFEVTTGPSGEGETITLRRE